MRKVLKKLPAALKKFVTYNVGYKIMALVFAIILWLVVVNIQNPASTTTFSNIPVQIINEESVLDGDHVYTIKSGKTASITVGGTRKVLGNLSASDFEAVADFSSLSLTGAAPITVTLSSEKARYENQIDVTLKTPSMVIDVEELVTKEFPVQIHYIGNKPDDLQIDKIEMSPETLTVSAPESIASTISSVGIMANYNEIYTNDPIEFIPNLYDAHGNEIEMNDMITLSSETITVQFLTYETKMVPIEIEAFGTPAEGYELTSITLSRNEAEVKGAEDLLAELDKFTLPSTLLTISDKTSNVTARVDLMDYLPEGLSFVDATDTNHYYVIVVAVIERSRNEPETTTKASSDNKTDKTITSTAGTKEEE